MRMRGTGEYERNLGCSRGHSGVAYRGVRGFGGVKLRKGRERP